MCTAAECILLRPFIVWSLNRTTAQQKALSTHEEMAVQCSGDAKGRVGHELMERWMEKERNRPNWDQFPSQSLHLTAFCGEAASVVGVKALVVPCSCTFCARDGTWATFLPHPEDISCHAKVMTVKVKAQHLLAVDFRLV
ncbi:hypothetical protein AXG93_2145s1250 [Marchantia polymorpha subsp. ruderalis]|uniref:Uncharacterized protein n=1 Tax=Marchantia polymorpha subsp. ruderalis TaxID=1480154 RepID=A0A176W0V5_MARPO|nr:hypothetical protein AXG93_2145s1250 [Marchantia polymorpha subsp. ruderalis]